MTEYLEAMINLRHRLVLPWHRVEFHARRPGWEAERLSHMVERVEPGMTVWDVGAECGDFTALYRQWVGTLGEVVPVEPQPKMWPDLHGTWNANGYPDPEWTVEAFLGEQMSAGARAVIRKGWPPAVDGAVVPDPGFLHLAYHTDLVETVSVDGLAEAIGPPDVLVLDIEGAECAAMHGAQVTLTAHPVLVYISVHPPTMAEWYGHTVEDLHAVMAGYGYGGEYLGTHGGEDFWFYERTAR